MKRFLNFALLICAVTVTLSGCGGRGAVYEKYVRGVMDTRYKGEFAAYLEVSGAAKDTAETVYEDTADTYADFFLSYLHVNRTYIDDEIRSAYVDLAKQVLSHASYSVEQTKKESSSYFVTLSVSPMNFLQIINAPATAYVESFDAEWADKKEQSQSWKEEQWRTYECAYAKGILEAILPFVENIGYDASMTVKVEIVSGRNGTFDVSDEDWKAADDAILKKSA